MLTVQGHLHNLALALSPSLDLGMVETALHACDT